MKIKNIPLILSAVVILASVVAAYTTTDVVQKAQGDELKTVKSTQQNFRPRIRKLETGMAGMKQRLTAIHDEQKATRILNASGRREILDAIKELGSRIPR
jgi:hypothetical protein